MRKRDEVNDPTSCLNRAREDEWVFVLLGRDRAAPAAVRAWIEERLRLGKNKPDDPQIVEARQWVEKVLDEQRLDGLAPADRIALRIAERVMEAVRAELGMAAAPAEAPKKPAGPAEIPF